jgi:hypothetical protein
LSFKVLEIRITKTPAYKSIPLSPHAEFPTSRLEMNAVADMFDHGDHMIDYMEFIAALRPDWEDRKPEVEQDVIHDEVQRQVMKCTCRQKFRVFQVGEGKYRVSGLFHPIETPGL